MTTHMPTSPAQPEPFDPAAVNYSSLKARVTRAELRRFRIGLKRTPGLSLPNSVTPNIVSAISVVFLVFVELLIFAFGVALVFLMAAVESPSPVLIAVIGVAVIAFTIAALVWVGRGIGRSWKFVNYPKKWFRLSKFAAENGLTYLPRSARPDLGGTILAGSRKGIATDRLIAKRGRLFEVGNFDALEQNVNTPVRYWGYMAIGLERRLPHIMLKSRYNAKKRRGIPGVVAKDQAMSLEGDFNTYFTLYAPAQYQRDALYVFAPDLMALMIDEAAVFEVEIVDNLILFYSPKAFDLTSRRTLRRLFRIARIVGTKTFRQTDRYWDDRSGQSFEANEVALPGRRLRQRASLVGAVFALIWIALQIFRFVHSIG